MTKQIQAGTPFFIHIPKTGGSSIRTLITANCSAEALLNLYGSQLEIFNACMNVPKQKRISLGLVQGHMPYGVHDYLGLSNSRYFFFLREPVARMLSDIEHSRRHSSHGFHQVLSVPELSLAERIERAKGIVYYRNNMTHFLSGTFFTRDVSITDFHFALERVRKSDFVGLTEQSELSLLIMARKLKWQYVIPHKCNVSPSETGDIVEQNYQACLPCLQYDIQLYQAATERFEEDVAAYGTLLQEAAEQMKQLLDQQETEYPEMKYQTYLVGDPLNIPLHEYSEQIEADSPLSRWLKTSRGE